MKITTKIIALSLSAFIGLTVLAPPAEALSLFKSRNEAEKEVRKENGQGQGEQIREEARNRIRESVALLRKARLEAVNNTVLIVSQDGKSYTVNTDDKTQLRRRFWGKATLEEMTIGDQLNVIGKWTDEEKTTIQARLIRNLSIQKRYGVFFGEIISLNGNGWVMKSVNRGEQTVTVSTNTRFVNRKQETINRDDLQTGHKVRVRGLWNNQNKTISEVTLVKDFSLPIINSTDQENE